MVDLRSVASTHALEALDLAQQIHLNLDLAQQISQLGAALARRVLVIRTHALLLDVPGPTPVRPAAKWELLARTRTAFQATIYTQGYPGLLLLQETQRSDELVTSKSQNI